MERSITQDYASSDTWLPFLFLVSSFLSDARNRNYKSVVLGMERLKSELQKRSLKCGGYLAITWKKDLPFEDHTN